MLPLSPHICQCMRHFFVKKPKFLSAASNLHVEQNLVHLGRFMHFSQKVVGVTLSRVAVDKVEEDKIFRTYPF